MHRDVFDALMSKRYYKDGWDVDEAIWEKDKWQASVNCKTGACHLYKELNLP